MASVAAELPSAVVRRPPGCPGARPNDCPGGWSRGLGWGSDPRARRWDRVP